LRYLSWIITIPIALLIVSFAVSNRETVELNLWPLPFQVWAPVYLVGLLALALGFLAGGLVAWLAGRRHRVNARRQTRRAERLEQDLAAERNQRSEAERRLAEAARRISASTEELPVDASARARLQLAAPGR
jgi:uncharacterized integral membrane protein